jgi:hypothetical protein
MGCVSMIGVGNTLELRAMFMEMMSVRTGGSSAAEGGLGHCLPANQPVTTVMRFSVRVPVLSEQMAVAPPMVSQAASTCGKHINWLSHGVRISDLRPELGQQAPHHIAKLSVKRGDSYSLRVL